MEKDISTSRGFFGIGIENGKTTVNVGTLWRSAYIFGASFIFTIGKRYQKQASDTVKAWRHVPLYMYNNFDLFYNNLPYDCKLIGIEMSYDAKDIMTFIHPQRCIYLLGAEDHGLTQKAFSKCHDIVIIPGKYCLNVAVAGSIIMYDRYIKAVKDVAF